MWEQNSKVMKSLLFVVVSPIIFNIACAFVSLEINFHLEYIGDKETIFMFSCYP